MYAGVFTARVVHGRVHVYQRVTCYMTVYMAVYRPCTRSVQYTTVDTTLYGHIHGYLLDRVHGCVLDRTWSCVREVYTFTSRVHARTRLCLWPVCTACTWPCTVHGRQQAVYGLYTVVYTCIRPCLRAVYMAVYTAVYTGHGRVRTVSGVVYARCKRVRTISNDINEAFTFKYYLLKINVM